MENIVTTMADILNDKESRGWMISAVVYSVLAIVISIWTTILSL